MSFSDEYIITEAHVHAVDDSPTIGAYSETHLKSERHGPYSEETIKRLLQELVSKYEGEGYFQCRGYSGKDYLVLKKDNLEITLRIQKYAGSDYK